MSEKEIRDAIRQICSDLDLRSRKPRVTGRLVVPLVLSAGLSIGACSEESDTNGTGTGQTTTTTDSGGGGGTNTGGEGGAGGNTAVGGHGGEGGAGFGGAVVDYMAPDP